MNEVAPKPPSTQEEKVRMPSGTIIGATVRQRRTIFSTNQDSIFEECDNQASQGRDSQKQVQCQEDKQSTITGRDSQEQGQRQEDKHSTITRITNRKGANASAGAKSRQTSRTIQPKSKQTPITAHLKKVINSEVEEQSDSDFDAYSTPPATPKRITSTDTSESNTNKGIYTIKGYIQTRHMDKMEMEEDQSTQISEETGEITAELEKMMEEYQGNTDEPQTIDIHIVHNMFKRLETRVNIIAKAKDATKTNNEWGDENETGKDDKYDDLEEKVERLELKNRNLVAAVQNMWTKHEELAEKVQKLEMSQQKKMLVISGLYTRKNKADAIAEIELFFIDKLGLEVPIDDFFTLGTATPKTIIVIMQNLKDKKQVMKRKKNLKDWRNEDDKKYYINDYQPAIVKEEKKYEKIIYNANEEKNEDEREKMALQNGKLFIDNCPYKPPLQPPNPQKLLDISTEELKRIMKLPICKGRENTKENNIFTGFTMAVRSIEYVQDAYFKMKISYPKARHIMCSYVLEDYETYTKVNGCDDGEHGASAKLQEFMMRNSLKNRVIFITRTYSGTKIGDSRIKCIIEAAAECVAQFPRNHVLDVVQNVVVSEQLEWIKTQISAKGAGKSQIDARKTKQWHSQSRPRGGRGGFNGQQRDKYTNAGQDGAWKTHHKRGRSSSDEQESTSRKILHQEQDEKGDELPQ